MGEVFPGVFKTRIPPLMYMYRGERVWMVVTTNLRHSPLELVRHNTFFRHGESGSSAEFLWKTSGSFEMAIRQFRLDFLRHLSDEILSAHIKLAIYFEKDVIGEEHAPSLLGNALTRAVEATGHGMIHGPLLRNDNPPIPSARVIDAACDQHARPVPAGKAPQQAEAVSAPPIPPPIASPPVEEHSATVEFKVSDFGAPDPIPVWAEPAWPAAPEPAPQASSRATRVLPLGEKARPEPVPVTDDALPGNFYQDYYGFEHMPFNNTPDSFFFFPTEKHQEALSRLIYAISERKGFVVISGEIGAGKTTLCRTLLTQLPRAVKIALITHTHLDSDQLIRAIAEDFDLPTEGLDRREILAKLNHFLIEQLAANCTVCIIIDEAQNLSPVVLEEVRMISNLETEQEKLVQLILLGQPELRDKLKDPMLKQLRQRIAVQYHLAPLNREETLSYITHRLKVAAPKQELHFNRAAMDEVFQYSGGVPRLINTLCDNALLTCFTRQQRKVTAKIVREAAADLTLEPQVGGFKQFWKFW